jgi:hypothetical protein
MMDGGCACGVVRYRLRSEPMFVNCCHCHECQRQTGSAFVINAVIETDRIELLAGEPEAVTVPTGSRRPHGAPAFEVFYDVATLWPAASLERRRAILGELPR